MSYLLNERLDENLEPFEKGLFFASQSGELKDLNDLSVINVAVDTIRQLYKGTISKNIIKSLEYYSRDGGAVYEKDSVNSTDHLYWNEFSLPFDAKISRMSKMSGYQYKIQNNDVGIVILLKSFHKPYDEETSHLKIELSPHFLSQFKVSEAQKIMDDIAKIYLADSKPCGVSPHLCVDVQGWSMPNHMQDHIITRSRQIRTYNGIDKAQFQGFDNVLTTYGRNETLMVGSAKAVQTAIYRKDLEIIKSDKVDFHHHVWGEYSLGTFDKNKPVTRFEIRFHHSVIKEFERGIGEDINSYIEVSQYFNNLWNYGLNTNRYQIKDTIAPIYQFLMQDIVFNENDMRKDFKRKQKQKTDTTAISRQIGIFIGNFLTIKARSGVDFMYVKQELINMSVFKEIEQYLVERKQERGVFWEQLKQKYLERQIVSKYA